MCEYVCQPLPYLSAQSMFPEQARPRDGLVLRREREEVGRAQGRRGVWS